MKNKDKISAIANEATKIMNNYPYLTYREAIMKAKNVIKGTWIKEADKCGKKAI